MTKRAAFLAGSAAALAAPDALRAAPQDPSGVSIGLPPGYMGAIVDYARDRGYFRDAGLQARSTILTSGAVIAGAVTGGSLDIGAVNVGAVAAARIHGVPLRIVAPGAIIPASGPSGDLVLVRKDSTLRGGADFNGKTVSIVALRTVQHAAFLSWLESRGGDPSSVKMIEVPLPAMAGALDAGRIDAAITNEPFTTMAKPGHRILGNVYDAMLRPFLVFALCATDQWLQANSAKALKFTAAIGQAARWANAHDADCRALLAASMKLDPQVARTMAMPVQGTRLDGTLIRPVVDVMLKYGFLDRAIEPSEMIWRPKA